MPKENPYEAYLREREEVADRIGGGERQMRWIPFFGFREVQDAEFLASIGLSPDWRWSVLQFEWFGWGWTFFARPIEPVEPWGGAG